MTHILACVVSRRWKVIHVHAPTLTRVLSTESGRVYLAGWRSNTATLVDLKIGDSPPPFVTGISSGAYHFHVVPASAEGKGMEVQGGGEEEEEEEEMMEVGMGEQEGKEGPSCWLIGCGANSNGQVGSGDSENCEAPVCIPRPAGLSSPLGPLDWLQSPTLFCAQ